MNNLFDSYAISSLLNVGEYGSKLTPFLQGGVLFDDIDTYAIFTNFVYLPNLDISKTHNFKISF